MIKGMGVEVLGSRERFRGRRDRKDCKRERDSRKIKVRLLG